MHETEVAVPFDERRQRAIEERELERIERLLVNDYAAALGESDVRGVFWAAVAAFADAHVRRYIPLLSERAARRRIHDLIDLSASHLLVPAPTLPDVLQDGSSGPTSRTTGVRSRRRGVVP